MVTALVVIAVAVGMLLLIRSQPDVDSFDPRSSAGDGATGAVLLLKKFGADVEISSGAPSRGSDERVLVIADRLNDDQRQDLLDFVDAGGFAVVADPASDLHGGASADEGAEEVTDGTDRGLFDGNQLPADLEANVASDACTIRAFESLRGVFSPKGLLFPVENDQLHCFGDPGRAFAIVREHGEGLVVGLGDNNIFTNRYLRYADNAGVLTALLAPVEGAQVRIMIGTTEKPSVSDIGSGDETLFDLVRPGVWMGLLQLGLAFVVFSVGRGIRPGRAVREPAPTPIAGNELVLATGNLMQRARHHERAGYLVRGEFFRQLVTHYRTPSDISIDQLSALVGQRSGIDPNELRDVLNAEVGNDVPNAGATLLRVAERIEQLRGRAINNDVAPRPRT